LFVSSQLIPPAPVSNQYSAGDDEGDLYTVIYAMMMFQSIVLCGEFVGTVKCSGSVMSSFSFQSSWSTQPFSLWPSISFLKFSPDPNKKLKISNQSINRTALQLLPSSIGTSLTEIFMDNN